MVYFDNSATTEICDNAKKYMMKAIEEEWGNPSSLHMKGITAGMLLDDAREAVSRSLGCKREEVIFTSGGTQANNIAVFGTVNAKSREGKKIIVSSVEHPSVMNCFDYLGNNGYHVEKVKTDKYGVTDLEDLEKKLSDDVILVSIMYVNNELGSIQPIEQISKLVHSKSPKAVFHCDMVQAYGKIKINVKKLGVDLASVSSHKIHGPKGAGALYVKNGIRLVSPVMGGEQERDIRPGTEPLPAIAGMYGAVTEMKEEAGLKKAEEIRQYMVSRLSGIKEVKINSADNCLPYITNISLPGYPSETLLNFLSAKEIYVSSGSACAKGHRSPVLSAAGLPTEYVNSSLRISISKNTKKEEVDIFIDALKEATVKIRKKV